MPTHIDTTRTPSLFHMEWLTPVGSPEADDHTRAVALRADDLLRAAEFIGQDAGQEVRVWIEGACASACVSVTWEPGQRSYGFHLLDESLTERLACVVFDDLACIGAQQSLGQVDQILDAMRGHAEPTIRVRVKKTRARAE